MMLVPEMTERTHGREALTTRFDVSRSWQPRDLLKCKDLTRLSTSSLSNAGLTENAPSVQAKAVEHHGPVVSHEIVPDELI